MSARTPVDPSKFYKIAITPPWPRTGISADEFYDGLKTLFPDYSEPPVMIGGFDGNIYVWVAKENADLAGKLKGKTFRGSYVVFSVGDKLYE